MLHHIKHCASCGARIVWFATPAGKRMPVDAATVSEGDEALDLAKHTSHFATCPDAQRHRRPKP